MRIIEEELVAIGIFDHQESVAPRTVLDWDVPGHKFYTQSIQCNRCGLVGRRLDVQGNEHESLADLVRPLVGKNQCTTLPFDLCNTRSTVFFVTPRTRTAKPLHVEAK